MLQTSVRQATTGDREALWEFIRYAYEIEDPGTTRHRIPERWIWEFQQNPFINEETDILPIWLAIADNKIVGQYCAIPARVKIGKEVFDAAWGCDFIVDGAFRGHGLGFELHRAFYKHYPVTLAITFAAATKHMWEKSGGLPMAQTGLYWYFTKMNRSFLFDLLDKYKDHPRFGKIITIFRHRVPCFLLVFSLNQVNKVVKFARSRSRKKTVSNIEEIFIFNEEIDRLSDATCKDFDIIVKRDSKLLNWRVFGNKQMDYSTFVARRNGEMKGYVVLRRPNPAELNIGTIADLYAAKNDLGTIHDLVNHAINYFGKSVNTIQCLTSVKNMATVLRNNGFFTIKRYQPVVLFSEKSLAEKFKDISRLDCCFSFIDHDTDQIKPV
jgi:GNAT superfamily N-acetyltransferase